MALKTVDQLSVSEKLYAEKIMRETEHLRKRVTLYKRNDSSLALFRTQLMNNITEFVIRKVTNKPMTKKLTSYIDYWRNDGPGGIGEDIVALFDAMREV